MDGWLDGAFCMEFVSARGLLCNMSIKPKTHKANIAHTLGSFDLEEPILQQPVVTSTQLVSINYYYTFMLCKS